MNKNEYSFSCKTFNVQNKTKQIIRRKRFVCEICFEAILLWSNAKHLAAGDDVMKFFCVRPPNTKVYNPMRVRCIQMHTIRFSTFEYFEFCGITRLFAVVCVPSSPQHLSFLFNLKWMPFVLDLLKHTSLIVIKCI